MPQIIPHVGPDDVLAAITLTRASVGADALARFDAEAEQYSRL